MMAATEAKFRVEEMDASAVPVGRRAKYGPLYAKVQHLAPGRCLKVDFDTDLDARRAWPTLTAYFARHGFNVTVRQSDRHMYITQNQQPRNGRRKAEPSAA
jgi:hypothetical protein